MPHQLPISVADLRSLSTERLQEARYKCQTNLFWFADRILRNKKDPPLVPRVHSGICNALVQKDPNKPLEDWSQTKQRIIISPRGTLKTVIESADIVQIILCDPNVRILLLSGKLDLAKTILGMVRGHFRNETMEYLFPEFCGEDLGDKADLFLTPARASDINYREPTVALATFESVKAGGHYNWLKLDDCTNEINCATKELVEKTVDQYDKLDPLLEPGGYVDFTGTRWAKEDLPEIIRQRGEEYKLTDEYQVDKVPQVLYFMQPIWTLKEVATAEEQKELTAREKNGKLKPSDVTLLWPEKIGPQKLFPAYRANRKDFYCQYLMNPEAVTEDVHFTLELLQRQTRPISEQPLGHQSAGRFINWDTAGIRSEDGDFSVGICVDWEYPLQQGQFGRAFIIDCVMEKFESSTDATYSIVNFNKKHNPVRCRIEDAAGAKNLEGELERVSKELQVYTPIHWGTVETTKDAKTERIIDLVDAFKRNQIQFWSGLPNLEVIYKQFIRFSRKAKNRKDDGPDCIAQLWKEYKRQIHPAIILQARPTDMPVIFTTPEPEVENNKVDLDELSAALEAGRWTMPHLL